LIAYPVSTWQVNTGYKIPNYIISKRSRHYNVSLEKVEVHTQETIIFYLVYNHIKQGLEEIRRKSAGLVHLFDKDY